MGTLVKLILSLGPTLALSGAVHVPANTARFELHRGLRDTRCTDHATGPGTAVSSLACANRCHGTTRCKGFFYNRGSRVCSLVRIIAIPQSGCLPEVGTDYYVRLVPGLFDGYDWTAADKALLSSGTESDYSVCTSHPYHVFHTDLAATQTRGCTAGAWCCTTKGCYPGTPQHYTGTWSRTASGRKCQAWNQQTPHKQSYYLGDFAPGETYVDAVNYCRDPDYSGTHAAGMFEPYLYTPADHTLIGSEGEYRVCTSHPYHVFFTDLTTTRQYGCDTGCCKTIGCFSGEPHLYNGTWSQPEHGRTCQAWAEQNPHPHHMPTGDMPPGETLKTASNFCRDPDYSGYLWCYTTDPDVRFGKCDIPSC